jgi:HrpA-like RNA helicase
MSKFDQSSESRSGRFKAEFKNHRSNDFEELLRSQVRTLEPDEDDTEDSRLQDEFFEKSLDEGYVDMLEFRQKLPVHEKKSEILNAIAQNQVILIEGKTGCGKSTQVAQFVLDDALSSNKGSRTRILCTQPRRIAGM